MAVHKRAGSDTVQQLGRTLDVFGTSKRESQNAHAMQQ